MTTHMRKGPPKVMIWPLNRLDSGEDISNHVRSFTVTKNLQQPAGTFSLTLSPHPIHGNGAHPARPDTVADLAWKLLPNTVVSIGFERAGGIMLGLVNRVARSVQTAGDRVSYDIIVSGSDLGKALIRDNVVLAALTVKDQADFFGKVKAAFGDDHPILKALPGVFGPETRDGVPTFLGATVEEVAEWILSNVGTMRIPLLAEAAGGDGLPGDYISTLITSWNDGRIWKENIHTGHGTVWEYLRSVLDADFYEIWIDTVPAGSGLIGSKIGANTDLPDVFLIIRPKPFDEPALQFADTDSTGATWGDLRTLLEPSSSHHEIDFSEVLKMDVGLDDEAAFSYFQVTTQHDLIGNPEALAEGLAYPLVDTFNGRRFGLRSYQSSLALLAGDTASKAAGDTDYTGEVAEDVRRFRNRLFNWYRLAPWFEGGSITVVGRDDFRAGDPVLLPWYEAIVGSGTGLVDKGLRFYCSAVSWGWSEGGQYTSTLTLERGHNDSLIDYIKGFFIFVDAPVTNPDHYAET